MREAKADIVIIGASLGGIAAALACAKMGKRVIVTEETRWIGGQATTQGVPLDEHPWIEQYGRTRSYAAFREGVRQYYRRHYPLTPEAAADPFLNPGAAWVTALGFEPRVGIAVLSEMLAPYLTSGLMLIWTEWKPVKMEMGGDRCQALTIEHTQSQETRVLAAAYYLDATELGDLLPLGNIEHVIGAESQSQTQEPLALEGEPEPLRQQPFTHLIAVDYLPGEAHTIAKPTAYDHWLPHFRNLVGYAETDERHIGDPIRNRRVFAPGNFERYEACIWNFRRCFCKQNFAAGFFPSDITMLMSGNEYHGGVLAGVDKAEAQRAFREARELSLSLLYFLQTEIEPGYQGKPGFPGIRPRGDVLGSDDGLAQYPYIRESRRIQAEFTVLEQHFRIDQHPDGPVKYPDSVGLGGYRIDIHEKAKKKNQSITIASHGQHWTQQIPLGALIPVRVENILPACKNLGVTHVTNGAFRLHPVEWNVGESVGLLAAYCLEHDLTPRAVRNTPDILEDFQRLLVKQGIGLAWPEMTYGRSYFSHAEHIPNWYFGEALKIITV